ncbi:MAG: hypothetical protein CMF62_03360 [Magnetococcales bacterium]|nr:hypothetical protein [Magnetococcales bacterium]|tara:strand:- start:16066 stop:17289 length:1224 start_codon:yes stop_codon:yes gene_type:complete
MFRLTPSELTISPISPVFGVKRKANPPGVVDAVVRDKSGRKVQYINSPQPNRLMISSPVLPFMSGYPDTSELSPLKIRPLWNTPPRHNPNSPTVVTFDPTPPENNNVKLIHPIKGAYDIKNVKATLTPFGTKLKFGKEKKDHDKEFYDRIDSISKSISLSRSPSRSPSRSRFRSEDSWVWLGNNLKHNNTLYSGSGVFLCGDMNIRGVRQLCIALFYNSSKNAYEDLGGGLHTSLSPSNTTLSENAKKEVEEESLLTLNLNSLDLNRKVNFQNAYVDSNFRDSKYRSHVVVSNIDLNEFKNNYQINRETISKAGTPADYRETSDVEIFDAKTLFNAIKRENGERNVPTENVKGLNYTISARAVKCLKDILNNFDRNNSLLQTVASMKVTPKIVTKNKFGVNFIQYQL